MRRPPSSTPTSTSLAPSRLRAEYWATDPRAARIAIVLPFGDRRVCAHARGTSSHASIDTSGVAQCSPHSGHLRVARCDCAITRQWPFLLGVLRWTQSSVSRWSVCRQCSPSSWSASTTTGSASPPSSITTTSSSRACSIWSRTRSTDSPRSKVHHTVSYSYIQNTVFNRVECSNNMTV